MYNLTVKNESGEKMELSHNPRFTVVKVEGLNPPPANIGMTKIASAHGSRKNTASIPSRNLTITLKINSPVAENRIDMYKYFKTGEDVTIYFKNEVRNVFIEGIVESVEGSLFTNNETFQISILCPQPFFKDVDYFISEIAKITALFEFPFEIEEGGKEFSTYDQYRVSEIFNTGDTDTGILIRLEAEGTVIDPIIWNSSTREFFGVSIWMEAGDVLEISTMFSNKYIHYTQAGNTAIVNRLSDKIEGSTWLQLHPGQNSFTYTTEEGDDNVKLTFTGNSLYGGV